MNKGCLLDASAVLARLNDEPGSDALIPLLGNASISAINLAEVAGKLAERGVPQREVLNALEPLRLEVVPVDRECAYRAAWLRPLTRSLGLSLADRVCLATAQALGLPVITTDRSWAALKIGVPIRILRKPSERR